MHPVMERVSAENVECFLNLWQFLGYDFSAMNQMPLKSNGTYALPDDIKRIILMRCIFHISLELKVNWLGLQ